MIFFDFFLHCTEAPFLKGEMRMDILSWDTCSYSKTIAAACRRAGVPVWSANQLRHAFATQLRRTHGIDAARAALGHSSGCRITDRYSFEAAADEAVRLASPAVEAIG